VLFEVSIAVDFHTLKLTQVEAHTHSIGHYARTVPPRYRIGSNCLMKKVMFEVSIAVNFHTLKLTSGERLAASQCAEYFCPTPRFQLPNQEDLLQV
jgi:hypothetical protein